MIPFIPLLIVTSLTEVFIENSEVTVRKGVKGVIIFHPLNTYVIQ
jgi:hypothetical protein